MTAARFLSRNYPKQDCVAIDEVTIPYSRFLAEKLSDD